MINSTLQDLRYTLRRLRKRSGFSLSAILTVALAIGVTTSVFSVLYAVLIRPLPYGDPSRIFFLQGYSPQGYSQPASYPEYLEWRRDNQSFTALAGYSVATANFETNAGPTPITRVSTTDNFFPVFGVNPLIGRVFVHGEDEPGRNDVVVLSYETWQQDFGGERILGSVVKIDAKPYTVIGVMPAGFHYPISTQHSVYTPLDIPTKVAQDKGSHWMSTIGLLKAGTETRQAEADMDQVFNDYSRGFPSAKGRRMKLVSIAEHLVGDTGAPMKLLLVAVLAVLAIGCANFAGLLLSDGIKREREIALRAAVGATRTRLIRQVLTEAAVLAIAGVAGGVLLAKLLLIALTQLLIVALARGAEVEINLAVLLSSLGVALAVAFLAAIVPALRLSGVAPSTALKSGTTTGAARSQHSLRAIFVVTQVALSLALLVTSGILLRTLAALRGSDLGFRTDRLMTVEVDLSRGAYAGKDVRHAFYDPLLEKVRSIPGVQNAAIVQWVPIQNWGWTSDTHIVGKPSPAPNTEQLAEWRCVTSDYFTTLGIRLVRGRLFDTKLDTATSPPVTVVNDAFVRKFFKTGEDPIGQHIDNGNQATIVGVVSDARQDIYRPAMAEMDYPMSQFTTEDLSIIAFSMQLVVRTSVDSSAIVPELRRTFQEVDPTLPFREPQTMSEVISRVLILERLENWLFGTFAALAVLLAVVGLYGLISHEVELSTRDIGLRMALGATRMQVLANVYRRVGILLVSGVSVGMILTLVLRKLLAALVVIQVGHDFGFIAALTMGLGFLGLLAASVPAWRAASTDPIQALRYE